MSSLVLGILTLPLAAMVVCFLLRRAEFSIIRMVALVFSLTILFLASRVAWNYLDLVADHSKLLSEKNTFSPIPEYTVIKNLFRFQPSPENRPDAGVVRLYLGIDGLNVFLLPLTALVFVLGLIAGWNSIRERGGEYFGLLFFLEFATLGAFLSFDLVLFYVFFELTIVPLFFLIGMWGGPNRQYAAKKVFVYTLGGGLITLLGMISLVATLQQKPGNEKEAGPISFSIPELVEDALKFRQATGQQNSPEMENKGEGEKSETDSNRFGNIQKWIFLALVCGFAIKVPVVPFHTWQPTAYFEAPTPITLIMSGILAKLGVFGFLRICVPLLPLTAVEHGAWLFGVLGVAGIIYGAGCAIAQDDFKKMVAYSSLSHLGFCMVGIFALNETGFTGGVLQMINHGLITGALLFLVSSLSDRYGTTRLKDLGGLGNRLKWFSGLTVFFVMCAAGLPGLNGFVGEVMCLFGMFDSRTPGFCGKCLAATGALGMVLGAWYLLNFVMKVFFGVCEEPVFRKETSPGDLGGMEKIALFPLAGICLFLGCYPQPVVDAIRPEMRLITRLVTKQTQQPVKVVPVPVPGMGE